MKLILALCAAALVSAATEDSISSRNSVPTGATPDPIYGSDNLGNIDYETLLFGSFNSEAVERLDFTAQEKSIYANQFHNWLTSRPEGRIYPAGIDEIINYDSITGGREMFNLTEERRLYFNNLLRNLVDDKTQNDVFNLPPGSAAAPGMPAASTHTQRQPPTTDTDFDTNYDFDFDTNYDFDFDTDFDGSGSGSFLSMSMSMFSENQSGATVPTGMPRFSGNASDDDITLAMSSADNGTSLEGSGTTGRNGTDSSGLNRTDSSGLNDIGAFASAGLNSTGNNTNITRNSTGSGAAGRNDTQNDTVSSRTSVAGAARAVQEWTIAGGIAAAALCLLL